MARGFIRNPLDVRLLILYILDHLILPVTMAELTDLALCDDGVDYFQFATALGALTENGHVAESEEGLLSITEKGHDNCAICANELPLSVRTKCDRSTQLLNKELKQRDQIRAVITPVPNQERYTVAPCPCWCSTFCGTPSWAGAWRLLSAPSRNGALSFAAS